MRKLNTPGLNRGIAELISDIHVSEEIHLIRSGSLVHRALIRRGLALRSPHPPSGRL